MSDARPQSGNPLPRVSIICRTVGRPTLEDTIRSVRSQTHHPIELILVDATGGGSPLATAPEAGIDCHLVNLKKPLSRPEAANAGLDAAGGDFILFLDDDDWIADDHIEQLLGVLSTRNDIGVAYSSAVKTTATGTATEEVFGKTFRPATLRHDNFIPIHAALIRRSLIEDGVRFDESLDIFEDWDFWLQLACRTQFHHHDACTAYYRAGGDSQTSSDDADHRYQKDHPIANGREKLFDKWLGRWTGRDYNEALGDIDKEQQLSAELEKLHYEHDSVSKELEETRGLLECREAELRDARHHITRLEQEIQRIFHSFSWQLTRPFRGFKRGVTLLSPRGRKRRSSPAENSRSSDD